MKISNFSKISKEISPERKTGKAESDAQRLAVWIERTARFAPEIGVKRSEALRYSPVRTALELDTALAVLLEQGRVTLAIDRRAHRIIPTAAILADGRGRK